MNVPGCRLQPAGLASSFLSGRVQANMLMASKAAKGNIKTRDAGP